METKWKTIEPNMWKPENEGDSIEGVLIGMEPKDDVKKISAKYNIENKDGMFMVWGSAILDDRMKYVKIGQLVRITFVEQTKNKKRQDPNIYKVEVGDTSEPDSEDTQSEVKEEKV